jgi:hypothetical protein
MLYLNPPYYYIDGVSLMPNHADPLQWYFMPLNPRFSANSVTGDIQLSLLKYRGAAGSGGFLNFDVNIGIDPTARDIVAGKLKAAAGLDGTPRLAPVPLIDGTVRLILLDKQTPAAPPAGGGPGRPPVVTPAGDGGLHFVETVLQATKPALYGDNSAVFSVQLTAEGVTVLDEALRGAMTPIGIIYDLDYVALRPAYQVKLNVDWDRVFHHVDTMTGVDGLFVSTDITKAVSELKDQRAIVMESDLFVPEGEDAASVIADFTRAENEVREMFTDAFFKPSLEPNTEAKDGWDRAADFATQLGRYSTTGGVSSLFSFRKKEVDMTRIDRKTLNVNLRQRTAVRRSIHPQGHLSGIAAVLGGDPSKYVMEVDLDNPFFKRRRLSAVSGADMAADQISAIHVEGHYGDTPQDVLLDPTHANAEMSWDSDVVNGAFQWPVTYDYEVIFKNVDTSQRPMRLSTKGRPGWPKTTTNESESIIPREDLYTIVEVPIYAIGTVLTDWPTVEVSVSYRDAANDLHQRSRITLNSTTAKANWYQFVLQGAETRFQYQISYIAADGEIVTMPTADAEDAQIRVFDPYPNRRSLDIVPALDWTLVDRAFVDVSYDDPVNGVHEAASYEFTQTKSGTQTFTVKLHDTHRLTVNYSISILFKDGHLVEIPPSQTLLPRLMMRSDLKGRRVIAVKPDGGDFAAAALSAIEVNISFDDQEGGISAADTFTFKSGHDQAQFEYSFVDPSRSAYTYRAKYSYDNGMTRSVDEQTSTNDEVILTVN